MSFASTCLLSYERPQFLRECILSLHENSQYPFELIVHDDGSEDPGVAKVLHSALEGGYVSTVIRNSRGHNQGVGTAINRMFHMAAGDPIVKMDQDMLLRSGWLKSCVSVLNRNAMRSRDPKIMEPRIGALGLFRYEAEPVHHEKMFVRSHDHELWDEVEDFVGSAIVVPRAVWKEFGPLEEHSAAFAEDIAFKRRLQNGGLVCGLLRKDLATNRGFGVGPSTVVVAENTVAEIHDKPKVFNV